MVRSVAYFFGALADIRRWMIQGCLQGAQENFIEENAGLTAHQG
jgi:hypothetical protein